MALRFESGAPLADLFPMMEQDRDLKSTMNPMALARAYQKSDYCWTYRTAGRAVACSGLYRTPAGHLEIWFCCHPCAADYMRDFVRLAQLTLRTIRQNDPIDIWARVAVGHRPGQRLARMVGLRFSHVDAGFEYWRFA